MGSENHGQEGHGITIRRMRRKFREEKPSAAADGDYFDLAKVACGAFADNAFVAGSKRCDFCCLLGDVIVITVPN
jgi:hypothetical protein